MTYLRAFCGRGSKNRTHDTRFWRWFAILLEIGVFTLLVALRLGGIRRKYDGFFLYDIFDHLNTHLTLANAQMRVNPCILTRTSVRVMLAVTISD